MTTSLEKKAGISLPGNCPGADAATNPSWQKILVLSLASLSPPSISKPDRNEFLKELSHNSVFVQPLQSFTLNQESPLKSFIQQAQGKNIQAQVRLVSTQADQYSEEQINDNINKVSKEILSKDGLTTVNKVSKCVCLYWLNKDHNEFRGGDQDGDKIPDRTDRDAYNGHGKTRSPDHLKPAPGSRGDEHYNCEYFATNFWKAFVETVGQEGGKCWIIHYDGHATVAWSYKGEFVIEEPQGGAPYFTRVPGLVERNMPERGQRSTVAGAQVYNMPVNHWLAKTGEWNQSIDTNWKPSLYRE